MIYLDAAATTPVRREVLEAMWPYLSGEFGNPSSHHTLGERAARALADLKSAHRQATLEMVASGKLTASQAIARVDAVALMSRLTHHAWRAVAHLNRAAAPRLELPQ